MNCNRCQELLSELLDGSISTENRALLNKHFNECFGCVAVRDDLHAIVNVAREDREQYVAPPNERALWLRIQNTVESEIDARRGATTGSAVGRQRTAAAHASWWANLINRRWELSLPQLTTAVTMIIVAVSLVTTMALRNTQSVGPDGGTSLTNEPVRSDVNAVSFDHDAYMQHQQPVIEYWRHRVEQRKSRWNPRVREAFQQNMDVIDQALKDSLTELRHRPHDEVSEDMLNAALRNKVELLQEFSEL